MRIHTDITLALATAAALTCAGISAAHADTAAGPDMGADGGAAGADVVRPGGDGVATIGGLGNAEGTGPLGRHELAIGSASRWMPSGSVDALTDGNMASFSLSAARTVQRLSMPGFELLAEGTLEIGGARGLDFQRVATEADVMVATVGLRARRAMCRACPQWRRWTLGARAAVGAARVAVSLSDAIADHAQGTPLITDRDYTWAAYVGAGIDYTPIRAAGPAGERFALGLRAELGYLSMRPVAVDGTPDRMDDDGAIRIPATTAALGDLDLSAVSLRIALISRF